MASPSVPPIYGSLFYSPLFDPQLIGRGIEEYAGDGSTTQIALAAVRGLPARDPASLAPSVKPIKVSKAAKMALGAARRVDAFAYGIAIEVLSRGMSPLGYENLRGQVAENIRAAIQEVFNIPRYPLDIEALQGSEGRLRELSSFAMRFGFPEVLQSGFDDLIDLILCSLEEGAKFTLLLLELGLLPKNRMDMFYRNACFQGSIKQENQEYRELIFKLIPLSKLNIDVFAHALLMRDDEIMKAVEKRYSYLEKKPASVVHNVLSRIYCHTKFEGRCYGKKWATSVLNFISSYVKAIGEVTDLKWTLYTSYIDRNIINGDIKDLQKLYPDDLEYQQALVAVETAC